MKKSLGHVNRFASPIEAPLIPRLLFLSTSKVRRSNWNCLEEYTEKDNDCGFLPPNHGSVKEKL